MKPKTGCSLCPETFSAAAFVVCFCPAPSGHDCHQFFLKYNFKTTKKLSETLGKKWSRRILSFLITTALAFPTNHAHPQRPCISIISTTVFFCCIFTFQFWVIPWDYSKFLPALHFINKHTREQNPKAFFICIKMIYQQTAILLWKLIFSSFWQCLCANGQQWLLFFCGVISH